MFENYVVVIHYFPFRILSNETTPRNARLPFKALCNPGHPLFDSSSPRRRPQANSPRAIFRRHGGPFELDFLEPRRRSLLKVMSPVREVFADNHVGLKV